MKNNPFAQVHNSLVTLIHKNDSPHRAPDENLSEVIGEQLRDTLITFGRMANPAGTCIVTAKSCLAPLLWEQVSSELPVDRQSHPELQRLVCDEFRRLAQVPRLDLPGAQLTLHPDKAVSICPIRVMAPG